MIRDRRLLCTVMIYDGVKISLADRFRPETGFKIHYMPKRLRNPEDHIHICLMKNKCQMYSVLCYHGSDVA